MSRSLAVRSLAVLAVLAVIRPGMVLDAEAEDVNRSARITVDLQKPGAPVPAGLYGIFMEERRSPGEDPEHGIHIFIEGNHN